MAAGSGAGVSCGHDGGGQVGLRCRFTRQVMAGWIVDNPASGPITWVSSSAGPVPMQSLQSSSPPWWQSDS